MLGTPWNCRRERRQDPAIRLRHRYFELYRNHGARTVPLLEVDDLDQASAEPTRGGAEQSVTAPMLVLESPRSTAVRPQRDPHGRYSYAMAIMT